MDKIIEKLRKEVKEELVDHILPFWMNGMKDEVNGGFYGRITGENQLDLRLLKERF